MLVKKQGFKKQHKAFRSQKYGCVLFAKPKLITWYQKHKRSLPWRNSSNPYHIWVSEVMLQQTTVKVVIPYYKKFLKKFSTLSKLAKADYEEVLPYWSGLGYYSRVKNLHKSAQIIKHNKYFPQTYKALLKLPGFGPYTARAVSALSFGEKTTVLDSNVIRVISRYQGFKTPWWSKAGWELLQQEANKWVIGQNPALINQALMELGALVCESQKPKCLLCPLQEKCYAYQQNQTSFIPLKQKKKDKEIWFWKPLIYKDRDRVALIKKHKLPVLKTYPVFPGLAVKRKVAPKQYRFIHPVTHHAIYVLPFKAQLKTALSAQLLWVKIKELKKQNPSSLLQKTLKQYRFNNSIKRVSGMATIEEQAQLWKK